MTKISDVQIIIHCTYYNDKKRRKYIILNTIGYCHNTISIHLIYAKFVQIDKKITLFQLAVTTYE